MHLTNSFVSTLIYNWTRPTIIIMTLLFFFLITQMI